MGLTARDLNDVERLAHLAANPGATTREEIYLAVTSLYRVEDVRLTVRERSLIHDILRQLTKDVEMAIRISLAEKLAEDPNAPHGLILMLADDHIEVARPVILRSPLLTEADLLRLIRECGAAHQTAVAGRPNIGEPVTAALTARGDETVLTELARNATARISADVFDRLVEKARRIETLREPLAKRRDLPPQVGMKLCDFISDVLKDYILRSYDVPSEGLQHAVEQARASVVQPMHPSPDDPDNSRRLIDKLFAAGQVKAGFLMRVLQQGNIELFELGLARMLGISLSRTRQLLYESGSEMVALSCRAVGIDRSVFPTVYVLSHKARALRPLLSERDLAVADNAFDSYTKGAALRRIQEGSSLTK